MTRAANDMTRFAYDLLAVARPRVGLLALQADETIEAEFRRTLDADLMDVFVSRVPSARDVTSSTLGEMAAQLEGAARLFPEGHPMDVIAYGCTSASAVIGLDAVARQIRKGCAAAHVETPLSALIAACRREGATRLALLSPYVAEVSGALRGALAAAGVETPVFGSFSEAEEAKVARIAPASVAAAARALVSEADGRVDALFLSCTNLKTLGVTQELTEELGLPVWSSNGVLADQIRRRVVAKARV